MFIWIGHEYAAVGFPSVSPTLDLSFFPLLTRLTNDREEAVTSLCVSMHPLALTKIFDISCVEQNQGVLLKTIVVFRSNVSALQSSQTIPPRPLSIRLAFNPNM